MQISEQGIVIFQLGIRLGNLDKSQKVHFFQAKIHLFCNIFARNDWGLEIHDLIQASKVKS